MRGAIARATVQTSIVLTGRLAIQAISILLIARLLGTQGYGAFASAAALAITLGSLSTFGSHYLLVIAARTRDADRSNILDQAIPLTIGVGCLLSLLHVALCRLWLDASDTSLFAIACIGVADIILQPLLWLRSFEMMGSGEAWRSQVVATLAIGMRLIAASIAWFVPALRSLDAYAPCHLVATLAGLMLALKLSSHAWPDVRHWRIPDRRFIRRSSGYAATSVTAMAPLEIDKVVAASLVPLGAAGIYAASTRVLAAAVLPVVAMMVAALPRLTTSEKGGNGRLLRAILGASSAYGAIIAALLWFSAPVVEQLFGTAYLGLVPLLRVLALAAPGLALRIAAGNSLIASERSWPKFAFEVSGVLVLCSTGWVFATHLGVIGIAWSVVLTETTIGIAMVVGAAAGKCSRARIDSSATV